MSGQEIKIEEDLEKLINWNSKALWRYNGREEEDDRKKGESSMKWSEVKYKYAKNRKVNDLQNFKISWKINNKLINKEGREVSNNYIITPLHSSSISLQFQPDN